MLSGTGPVATGLAQDCVQFLKEPNRMSNQRVSVNLLSLRRDAVGRKAPCPKVRGGTRVSTASVSWLCAGVSLVLVVALTGCATVATGPLSPADRPQIRTMGLLCTSSRKVGLDVDLSVLEDSTSGDNTAGVDFYTDYMLYGNVDMSLGEVLVGAAALGLLEGLFSPSPERALEKQESFTLSEMLRDWDWTRMIRATFAASLAEDSDIAVIDLEPPLSKDEIEGSIDSLAASGLDAITNLRVTALGLRTNERGVSVYSEGSVEIISLKTGEVMASAVAVFDYDHARRRFEALRSSYFAAGHPEARGADLDLDSLFVFPVATEGYQSFRDNDGRLLKRELKFAFNELIRMLLESLGLRERDQHWEDEYRKVPAGLQLARHPDAG